MSQIELLTSPILVEVSGLSAGPVLVQAPAPASIEVLSSAPTAEVSTPAPL